MRAGRISATVEHYPSDQDVPTRVVGVEIGKESEFQPRNLQKLEHCGRRCTVVGWAPTNMRVRAFSVTFVDNCRRDRVDPEDLVEVTPVPVN